MVGKESKLAQGLKSGSDKALFTAIKDENREKKDDPGLLLKYPFANVNAVEEGTGMTPLHYASGYGYVALTDALIAKGANIKAKNSGGYTPLHYASANGRLAIVKTLLEKGADVNAVADIDTDTAVATMATPLHLASFNGHIEVIKTLLENGANIEALVSGKRTPLHMAAIGGKTEAFNLLIEKGANTTAKDAEGIMPAQVARDGPTREMLRELVDIRKLSQLTALDEATGEKIPSDVMGKIGKFLGGKKTRVRRSRKSKRRQTRRRR